MQKKMHIWHIHVRGRLCTNPQVPMLPHAVHRKRPYRTGSYHYRKNENSITGITGRERFFNR